MSRDRDSAALVRELAAIYRAQNLHRPFRIRRYEHGERLEYRATSVWPVGPVRIKMEVERFVGGGFAGQVYKVILLECDASGGLVEGLEKGRAYALKILVPPSGFSRIIRDAFYGISFQGPFSLQVNPDAGKAGALWQKYIRRAAKDRLGSERAVVDIIATLVDPILGSCGELSEWVEGRLWRYEVDDNLFARHKWKPGRSGEGLGSAEYRAKKSFMNDLVRLMHDMGAHELARQYEWWTLKSQPNALKRLESDDDPEGGLVAVDFRAGMALLPFLPQCPADFKLIVRGMGRGSLVQFDRGDISKLESFVSGRPQSFEDMDGALAELKEADTKYRESLPDIAHHHIRLITRPRLWKSIAGARITSWEIRNKIDTGLASTLRKKPLFYLLFLLLGVAPVLSPLLFLLKYPGRNIPLWFLWLAPLAGPFLRKFWGREAFRKHWGKMVSSPGYLKRAFNGRAAEAMIRWLRSGRVSDHRALALARKPGRYLLHLPLSILPPGLHRFLTDKKYFKERLDFVFARPLRLYFRPEVREKWLRDMIAEGGRKGMLTSEESERILSQIKEPFIQKYLKSLAVHVLTLPITQVISIVVAFVYIKTHPELTWQQASVAAGIILGLFQVIPLSPGSFVRGLYTTFLILKERNFRDYKLAFAISYFKYIGYLAFPLQMAYRYPELARFMAGHWATGAVHIVPIFGERGAWLEHAVFDLFYNYPLSLGKRVRERDEHYQGKRKRTWAVPLASLAGTLLLALLDWRFIRINQHVPALKDIWWIAIGIPFLAAFAASMWSRRRSMGKRMTAGLRAGALVGLLYAMVNVFLSPLLVSGVEAPSPNLGAFALNVFWKVFIFSLLSVIGAFLAETRPLKS